MLLAVVVVLLVPLTQAAAVVVVLVVMAKDPQPQVAYQQSAQAVGDLADTAEQEV
jgi:hypothetical protein